MQTGFTLIECLVALLILSLGLGIGLGAVLHGRSTLDLALLQADLDRTLDRCHEALRARSIDVEKLVSLQAPNLDPITFNVSAVPSTADPSEPASRLKTTVSVTDVADLFQVTFEASGSRGLKERHRTLTVLFFEPGLSQKVAAQNRGAQNRGAAR